MVRTKGRLRPGEPPAGSPLLRAVPLAVIAAAVFVCFQPVLGNDFVDWDDIENFVGNAGYRGLSPSHLAWMFTTFHLGHYQPVSWLSHGLVYTICGLSPFGFHLVNLLLHAGNAVMVYFLIRSLLRRGSSLAAQNSGTGLSAAAIAGALFFAVHPLRVEVVAWATERREVLSSFWLLLTLLTYLQMQDDRRTARSTWRAWLLVSLGRDALSLPSKAMGMTLPIVLLILDTYPLRR